MSVSWLGSDRQGGFTLVEMLVALSIFALLAAAGVGILRTSVDTQAAVSKRLSALGQAGRLQALLITDLGQAVDRQTRASTGVRPAFDGDGSGMMFVRGGWANLDGAARSNLQRVSWRSGAQQLVRSAFGDLDGPDERPSAAAHARPIRSASFRYRTSDGTWSTAFRSSERQVLPSAVELTIVPLSGDPLVMVIALPQGGASTPVLA